MYIPKLYRQADHAEILAFLQQNNFPALVTFDGTRPVATHLPVEIQAEAAGDLTIYGHLARANPQWRTFNGQEALLIFQGPHTYISPRWYNQVNVPTWNYLMVHAYGPVREVQGAELLALLSRLVQKHEVNTGYQLETLPADFVQKEMRGVFGLAVKVTRLEASYKLSQNRNAEDQANILRELDQREDEASQAIAAAMRAQRGNAA